MRGLKGKIAVVSGACNGIGEAVARRLAEEGCTVAGIDLKAPREELKAELAGKVHYYQADISDDASLEKTTAAIREEVGAASILINNAAHFVFQGPDATVEDMDKICQVNIRGTSRLTHYVLPSIRECGGGSIVNTSSISGFVGQDEFATYNATKFAIRGLTKCWAIDLAKDNIRVNALCPGYIETAAFANYCESLGLDYDEENRKAGEKHLLGRQGRPEEVAAAAAFLASEESSFMTGSDLLVDGGYLAR